MLGGMGHPHRPEGRSRQRLSWEGCRRQTPGEQVTVADRGSGPRRCRGEGWSVWCPHREATRRSSLGLGQGSEVTVRSLGQDITWRPHTLTPPFNRAPEARNKAKMQLRGPGEAPFLLRGASGALYWQSSLWETLQESRSLSQSTH